MMTKVADSTVCLINYASAFYKQGISGLKRLLYPDKCLKCGIYIYDTSSSRTNIEKYFCPVCIVGESKKTANNIEQSEVLYEICRPFCLKCSIQFPSEHGENHVCGSCITDPFKLHKIRACVQYKGLIKVAIPLLKYQSKLSLVKVFEQLLFQAYQKHFHEDDIDLIMPIPLHGLKARQRGFNQAFMMIRNFQKLYFQAFDNFPPWQIDIGSLVRHKKTTPQTGFDIKQRKINVRNTFLVKDETRIKDKSILLIDDVFTTGATCNEAAGLLLRKGARRVDALVLARAQ